MVFTGYVAANLLPAAAAQQLVTTKAAITMNGTPTYLFVLMSALLDKLRRAREFKVQAAGFTFTIPSASDRRRHLELAGQKTARAILPFIIGWEA